jgi:hypothetical protein
MIRKAFDVSVEAHKNNEENQEAYIFHPLLWQNSRFRNRLWTSIAAALLRCCGRHSYDR